MGLNNGTIANSPVVVLVLLKAALAHLLLARLLRLQHLPQEVKWPADILILIKREKRSVDNFTVTKYANGKPETVPEVDYLENMLHCHYTFNLA